jgi:hypothetical protein
VRRSRSLHEFPESSVGGVALGDDYVGAGDHDVRVDFGG